MGRMKEIFIGEGDRYNYSQMCLLNNPFSRGEKQKVNFYSVGTSKRSTLCNTICCAARWMLSLCSLAYSFGNGGR
jgi:hypothetical protein